MWFWRRVTPRRVPIAIRRVSSYYSVEICWKFHSLLLWLAFGGCEDDGPLGNCLAKSPLDLGNTHRVGERHADYVNISINCVRYGLEFCVNRLPRRGDCMAYLGNLLRPVSSVISVHIDCSDFNERSDFGDDEGKAH